MSELHSIALPSEERAARFRTAFTKKLKELISPPPLPDGERESFDLPDHSLNDSITSADIASITSTGKKKVGLPLIFYKSSSGPILLSTEGVFFATVGDGRGYYYWSELDFIAYPDLTTDDATFRLERDESLIDQSVTVKSQMKKGFIIWLLPTAFLITTCTHTAGQASISGTLFLSLLSFIFITGFAWGVPLVARAIADTMRQTLKETFNKNPTYQNVIRVGPRQMINVRPARHYENLLATFMLALTIYRAQQTKYGPMQE
jgi:hypothetical protein